jgi:YVTN family beta-propeller protein
MAEGTAPHNREFAFMAQGSVTSKSWSRLDARDNPRSHWNGVAATCVSTCVLSVLFLGHAVAAVSGDAGGTMHAAIRSASSIHVTSEHAATPAASNIYVTNERSGELSVIDPATHDVVATVALGKRPRGMQFSPDGSKLYVALSGSPIDESEADADADGVPTADRRADGIGVVDLQSHTLVTVLRGVSDPEQLAVGADGRRLYVVSEDTATTAVLDASDGRLLSTLTVGHRPEGIALSPDGRWVYVASQGEDELSVIDTRDDSVAGTIDVGAHPRNIVFSPREAVAYVACEDSAMVDVIDTRMHRVTAHIPIPGKDAAPVGMALSADGGTLYVATGRGRTLVAIDTTARTSRSEIEIGARPGGVTVSADGKRLYSANGPSNDVAVVDLDSMTVQRRIAVGQGPWTAATRGPVPSPASGPDAVVLTKAGIDL